MIQPPPLPQQLPPAVVAPATPIVQPPPQQALIGYPYTIRRVFWTRFFLSSFVSLVYFSCMLWIPILGWFMWIFTPVVFLMCMVMTGDERAGLCPYCSSRVSTMTRKPLSLKCPRCQQVIVISGLYFVRR